MTQDLTASRPRPPEGFADLLAANARYSISFPHGFDGIAHAGVLILTCMDSRLEPLEMFGLFLGEAKILRTAGGRLTDAGLAAMVMGVHKLRVNRILIVPHTLCAAASKTEDEMRATIEELAGVEVGDFRFGVDPDQLGRLRDDVDTIRAHPLVGPFAEVGGFLYNVETGLLHPIC